jgi:hypothetical protein
MKTDPAYYKQVDINEKDPQVPIHLKPMACNIQSKQ